MAQWGAEGRHRPRQDVFADPDELAPEPGVAPYPAWTGQAAGGLRAGGKKGEGALSPREAEVSHREQCLGEECGTDGLSTVVCPLHAPRALPLQHYDAIMRYISQPPLLLDVHIHKPMLNARTWMDSLLAFFPGLQVGGAHLPFPGAAGRGRSLPSFGGLPIGRG